MALTVTVLTDDVANEGLDILQRVGSLLSRHRTKLIPMKQAGTLNHMRMSTEPHARHQDAPNRTLAIPAGDVTLPSKRGQTETQVIATLQL